MERSKSFTIADYEYARIWNHAWGVGHFKYGLPLMKLGKRKEYKLTEVSFEGKSFKKRFKSFKSKKHPFKYQRFFQVSASYRAEFAELARSGGVILPADAHREEPTAAGMRLAVSRCARTGVEDSGMNGKFGYVDTTSGEVLVSGCISQQGSRDLSQDLTHRIRFEVERSGVTVKRSNPSAARSALGGRRSEITGFSDASKRNLRRIVENAFPELVSQVALTYHEQFPGGHQVKEHLNSFLTWLRRRVPGVAYLWILEFQTRGVPHFHLYLSLEPDPGLQAELAGQWVKITSGSREQFDWHNHRRNWIPWDMGSGGYLCKYLDKEAQKRVPEGFGWVGRFWAASRGLRPNPVVVEDTDLYEISADEDVLKRVVRVLGRLQERRRAMFKCPHPSLRRTQKTAYVARSAEIFWRLLDYYTNRVQSVGVSPPSVQPGRMSRA